MPKPPRFQSQRTRQVVITLAMVFLLALSLGLAWLFTKRSPTGGRFTFPTQASANHTQVTIGPLKVSMPDHWKPLANTPPIKGLGRAYSLFIHQAHPQDRLLVALTGSNVVLSPQAVLEHVRGVLFPAKETTQTFSTYVRHGHRVALVTSLHQINSDGTINLYHLAIFTDTGRHHGVAMISQSYSPENLHRLEMDYDLDPISQVTDIATQATFDELQPATSEALRDAGLARQPGRPSTAWTLATCADAGAMQPILILPTTGPGGFWLARVRGGPAIPPTSDNASPAHEYAPATLLHDAVGPGENDEIPAGEEAQPLETPAGRYLIWRWQHPLSRQDPSLYRERWYVAPAQPEPAARQGVFVVDLLYQQPQASQAQAQVKQALATLIPLAGGDGSPDQASAVERGRSIARSLRDNLPGRMTASLSYCQYLADNQLAGLLLSQNAPGTVADSVRGRSLLIQTREPRFIYEESWASSANTDRAWQASSLTVKLPDDQGMRIARRDRQELGDGVLKQIDQMAGNRSLVRGNWSQPVNDAFVPMFALDDLPVARLADWARQGPALVWSNLGQQPPAPLWLEVRQEQANDVPEARWRLAIRRPAGLEPIVLWLDEQGRTIRCQWHDASSPAVAAWPYVTQRVSRQELVQMFESLETDIQNWEKDWTTP